VYRPNNITLVIVGDTTPAEIKPPTRKGFCVLEARNTPKKSISKRSGAEAGGSVFDRQTGRAQSLSWRERSHRRATARRKLRWESGTTFWAGRSAGA